ncbi:MAG: uroporphyrinogen decarboxylase [Magnetococcales bacterium]|nr:uroporphyrinogen decarboxylase [Magnetococcales bacterium]NGZ26554.1 uroporphyrinogen decarboxylase [Magnetococcales bacterium]
MNTEPTLPFLRACLRLPVSQTPMWIMRQAGRYLPEYRATRAQAGSFLQLCRNPELATEVTMQPLRRYGLDAAILFSDILVVAEAMGIKLSFNEGEGPQLEPRINSHNDVLALHPAEPEDELGYVLATVRTIRKELDGRIPLIGFAGSPWTVATYMVEGGSSKTFSRIKGMMFDAPLVLQELLDRLADVTAAYLNAQIRHGAQAVQIFDTWGGVLSPRDFRAFSLRAMIRIMEQLDKTTPQGEQVPVILFAKGCGPLLEEVAATGCQVVGLDWTTDLARARERVAGRVALQGNMDPAILYASEARIRQEVEEVLTAYGPHAGHIFNLGHGIAQDVDPARVSILVDAVRQVSRRILSQ